MHNYKNKGYAAAIPSLNQTLKLYPGHALAAQALDVAKLKPRYAVGKELRMVPLLQRLLPEIAFERMIAKQFNI